MKFVFELRNKEGNKKQSLQNICYISFVSFDGKPELKKSAINHTIIFRLLYDSNASASLTLSMLGKKSADDILKQVFLFPQKIGFDIARRLSPVLWRQLA